MYSVGSTKEASFEYDSLYGTRDLSQNHETGRSTSF